MSLFAALGCEAGLSRRASPNRGRGSRCAAQGGRGSAHRGLPRSGRPPPAPSGAGRRSQSCRAKYLRRGSFRRGRAGSSCGRSSEGPWLCLCPQPSLTERTADDHRQPPARYGAMGSALRGRLATVLLHHVRGHDPR